MRLNIVEIEQIVALMENGNGIINHSNAGGTFRGREGSFSVPGETNGDSTLLSNAAISPVDSDIAIARVDEILLSEARSLPREVRTRAVLTLCL